MPSEIVAIVLVAALAHASWNALVKSDDDRLVTLGAANAVRFLICIPIVLALPLPARASWPYLAASAILHVGYYVFLISAYRFGDLSKVYPLARGLSPLIVAAGAFVFAGERLSAIALVGVAVACTGIASLSLGRDTTPARGDCEGTEEGQDSGGGAKPTRGDRDRVGSSSRAGGGATPVHGPLASAESPFDAGGGAAPVHGSLGSAESSSGAGGGATPVHGSLGRAEPLSGVGGGAKPAYGDRVHAGALSGAENGAEQARNDRRGVVFAAATAVFIAAYTLTDAMGARLSGHAVSYVAWLSILDGLPMLLAAGVLRRAALSRHLAARAWKSMAGGALQLTAYGLVVWALVLAPMAAVSALRETSVLFAAIIGVKLLGEPLGRRRITAAALVAAGIMLIEWG